MKRDRVTTSSDSSDAARILSRPSSILGALFVCLLAPFGLGIAGDNPEEAIEVMNHPVELTDMAKQAGTHWIIRGVEIDGLGLADLRVEHVEVFAKDAAIIVNDGIGETIQEPPATRFVRGEIEGIPGSIVALMQTEDGDLSGMMTDGNVVWELKRPSANAPLETSAIDAGTGGSDKPFACGQEDLPEVPGALEHLPLSGVPDIEALPAGQLYQATIAIDTDYELYRLFGGTSATTNYIGNLFNYISGIYEVELQTRLRLGNVYLWTTAADPWVETGTSCRLYEFGRYWRDNRASVPRTLAHFLSGRSLGGGVAWLNQLCQPARSYPRATDCASVGDDLVYGGFGVSGNLTGTIGTSGGPAWDAKVVAHELGHNFSSPHTHCYGNIGGSSSPVDACWNQQSGAGCWTGATSLPGVNALRGGAANARNGTIMSYCHQHSGGLGNIAGTFGLGHPFGVHPNRVPKLMAARVAAVASANPSCLPTIDTGTQTIAAILPYARAIPIGNTATAFASVINSGHATATGCSIALPAGIPATFSYQTTDAANALIGALNTPVDIAPGATQGFVFGITPSQAMAATEIPLVFDCANTAPAPSNPGLNTFILSASASAPPDLLAIGATPSGDGVVRLPSRNATGFFATAAVNIGSIGALTVSADDGGRGLALNLRVCETNARGDWLVCGNHLTRDVGAGQTLYYTVLASGNGQPIAFDPANNRLFLRFAANGTTVGATNVAVTAP